MKKYGFSTFCFVLFYISAFAADRNFFSHAHEIHKDAVFYPTQKHKPGWWDSPYFLGDWGGARQSLAEKGLTLSSSYIIDVAANPVGGKHQGIAQASSWGTSLWWDLGKKLSLPGWHFYASCVWRFGTNLSSRKIENQFPVQQVFGGQSVRLVNLYIKKEFLGDRFWGKLGRLDAGNQFLVSEFYSYFMNNSIDGNPVAIFLNTPFSAYPNGTWGAYLEGSPQPEWQFKVGTYNTNSRVAKNRKHGLDFSLRNDQGWLWVGEASYLPFFSESKKLAGHYRVGLVTLTKKKEKILGGKARNYTYYIQVDQTIYRKTGSLDQSLAPFFAFLGAPSDNNLFPYFTIGGIVAKGLIPGRELDAASLGIAYGSYSSYLRKKQKKSRQPQQKAETIYELNYRWQVNPWFYIQPGMQYIQTPKGYSSIPNAWVLGMQSALVF